MPHSSTALAVLSSVIVVGCGSQPSGEPTELNLVDEHLERAHELRQAGDDDAAIDILRAARLRQPERYEYAAILARMLAEHSAEEAVGHYMAAIALRPDEFKMWRELGLLLANELGDAERSLRVLHAAAERWPNSGRPHVAVGLVQRASDEDDEAAFASFRRAVEIDPELAEGHGHIAEVLARRKDHEAATGAARRAVELAPDSARWQRLLLRALGRVEEHDEIIAQCLPAIRCGVKAGPVVLAGSLRRCSHEPLAALVAQIEAAPKNDAYEWLYLAMAKHRLGESEAGRALHARAVAWAAEDDNHVNDALARLFSASIRYLDSEAGAPANK